MNQDLDARFPQIIAPARFVVDPKDRFQKREDVPFRDKRSRFQAEIRSASEAATDEYAITDFAAVVSDCLDPYVVAQQRRAVML